MAMTFKGLLKGAALGAGTVILFAGLALAQTPAPAPAAPATPPAVTAPASPPAAAPATGMDRRERWGQIRSDCRSKTTEMRGPERREAMRKCMEEGRSAAGMGNKEERRGQFKQVREACRAELKDQRFTEDERRKAMQECAVKKDPSLAKGFACRDEAEAKKLERGTKPFREFMRSCHGAR